MAAVVCLITSYLVWYLHDTMKKLPTDQTIHILLSYINLVNAIVVMYSMRFTDSVLAYISNWMLIMLQAFWLLLAGTYECYVDLPMHEIATYLAVLSLLVVLAVTVVYACFGPASAKHDNLEFQGDFAPLKTANDTDDNDAC